MFGHKLLRCFVEAVDDVQIAGRIHADTVGSVNGRPYCFDRSRRGDDLFHRVVEVIGHIHVAGRIHG